MQTPFIFAETQESASGIGAFNINLKGFLFQLITFVIVLLVLRRFVLPRLIKTIEDRRKVLEDSLQNAKKTEQALADAEAQAVEIIQVARRQADQAVADAVSQAKEIIAQAEIKAEEQSERILAETKERLNQEKLKLKEELKDELADIVIITAEKVLQEKIDEKADQELVNRYIKEMARG